MIGAVAWAVPRLPLERAQTLGAALGRAVAMLPGKRRRRVENHLRIAFPDGTMDSAQRAALARESYSALGSFLCESLWVSSWKDKADNGRVRFANEENWRRTLELARERGRGLIIYTAHLGTPELFGRWLSTNCGMPLMAVAAPSKIAGLQEHMSARRQSGNVQVVLRGEAGSATLRHLRAGGVLVMFVDHSLKGPGVEVPFFGRGAHTLLAPAKLALQSGAVGNTLFALREGAGRFSLECDDPMEIPSYSRDRGERFRQEAVVAAEYTGRIEAAIRRHPQQYLWMHKRWQKRSDTLPFPS